MRIGTLKTLLLNGLGVAVVSFCESAPVIVKKDKIYKRNKGKSEKKRDKGKKNEAHFILFYFLFFPK
jgi:hypothetical protein